MIRQTLLSIFLVLCFCGEIFGITHIVQQTAENTAMGSSGSAGIENANVIPLNEAKLSTIKSSSQAIDLAQYETSIVGGHKTMDIRGQDDAKGTYDLAYPSYYGYAKRVNKSSVCGIALYPTAFQSGSGELTILNTVDIDVESYTLFLELKVACAFQVKDKISLGLGLRYVQGETRMKISGLETINTDTSATGSTGAFSTSVTLDDFIPKTTVGYAYRSTSTMTLEGDDIEQDYVHPSEHRLALATTGFTDLFTFDVALNMESEKNSDEEVVVKKDAMQYGLSYSIRRMEKFHFILGAIKIENDNEEGYFPFMGYPPVDYMMYSGGVKFLSSENSQWMLTYSQGTAKTKVTEVSKDIESSFTAFQAKSDNAEASFTGFHLSYTSLY